MTQVNATTARAGGEQMASGTSQDQSRMIITIDGPAGTGKTTVAHRLSSRLGLDSLDTGAMYRAIALRSLEDGIAPTDQDAIIDVADSVRLDFDWEITPPALLVDGHPVGDRIRLEDVDQRVSAVAGIPRVRAILVRAQRAIADKHPRLVTEGRDQGSVVFPDAEFRFYLDASPVVRARRRVQQLKAAGQPADVDEVRAAIEARDLRDEGRTDGPLRVPDGATIIDTSELTLDQVVTRLGDLVEDWMKGHPEKSLP